MLVYNDLEYTVKFQNKPWGLYFSKALFKGLIFGGAYIRRGLSVEGFCISKLIGLTLKLEENLPFCFVLLSLEDEGNFPSTSSYRLIFRGFFVLFLSGLIYMGELIFSSNLR